jgi:hypothetical protein
VYFKVYFNAIKTGKKTKIKRNKKYKNMHLVGSNCIEVCFGFYVDNYVRNEKKKKTINTTLP